MSKDNKEKQTYSAGCSNQEGTEAKKIARNYQEHPIATLDEPLVGWLVKTKETPMPEILMVNGVVYQKIKLVRYAGGQKGERK